MKPPKIPRSVLVMIHTPDMQFLLLKRVCKNEFSNKVDRDFWQSVTGSLDFEDELPIDAARRELFEETGLRAEDYEFRDLMHTAEYEIFPEWRYRYAQGVTHNTEYQFALCVPDTTVAVRRSSQSCAGWNRVHPGSSAARFTSRHLGWRGGSRNSPILSKNALTNAATRW